MISAGVFDSRDSLISWSFHWPAFLGTVNAVNTTQLCLIISIPSITGMFCFLSRVILRLKSDMLQHVLIISSSHHYLTITYTAMLVILLLFSSSFSKEIMKNTSLPGPGSKIAPPTSLGNSIASICIHSLIERVSSKRTSPWNPMLFPLPKKKQDEGHKKYVKHRQTMSQLHSHRQSDVHDAHLQFCVDVWGNKGSTIWSSLTWTQLRFSFADLLLDLAQPCLVTAFMQHKLHNQASLSLR